MGSPSQDIHTLLAATPLLIACCTCGQVYSAINNGVYRAGFATSQTGYDAAVGEMHQLLSVLDSRLGQQRFLLGDWCGGGAAGVMTQLGFALDSAAGHVALQYHMRPAAAVV